MAQQQRRYNGNIVGTRRTVAGSRLSGVEKVVDIFLGGCPKNTSVQDVSNYCEEAGIVPKKVEMLQTKSEWHVPFKISLSFGDREKMLDAAFWPENCFVRKYFRPKVDRSNS